MSIWLLTPPILICFPEQSWVQGGYSWLHFSAHFHCCKQGIWFYTAGCAAPLKVYLFHSFLKWQPKNILSLFLDSTIFSALYIYFVFHSFMSPGLITGRNCVYINCFRVIVVKGRTNANCMLPYSNGKTWTLLEQSFVLINIRLVFPLSWFPQKHLFSSICPFPGFQVRSDFLFLRKLYPEHTPLNLC